MKFDNKALLPQVKSNFINLPKSKKRPSISGIFIYYLKKKNPVLMLIRASSQDIQEMIYLGKYLALLGYSCFIPILKNDSDPLTSIEKNAKYVSRLVSVFRKPKLLPKFLRKFILSKNVGLVSFSQSVEISHLVSELNPRKHWIKGIFSIAPASGFSYPAVKHPLFIILGSADSTANLISWDRSNTLKSGIIIRGGRHENYFNNPDKLRPLPQTDPTFIIIPEKTQFQILISSLALFFREAFSAKKGNYLNALHQLQVIFDDEIRVLYHNYQDRKLIEGSDFYKKKRNFLKLKDWKGTFIIDSSDAEELERDCINTKNTTDHSKKYFLFSGIARDTGIYDRKEYNKAIKEYLKVSKVEGPESGLDSKILEKIISFYKKIVESDFKNKITFVNKEDLTIANCLLREILIITESEEPDWDKLRKILTEDKIKSIDFLIEVNLLSQELRLNPWYHAAYGRELKWNKDTEAIYLIEKLHKIKCKKYQYLSLRIGQNYKSHLETEGNLPLQEQIIDIYFYSDESPYPPIRIKVDFPIKRKNPDFNVPNDLLAYPEIIFKSWITDIELQCYLTYHIIPIPPGIKKLQKIELHFLNRTGAIMLSEVALTN